MSHKHRIPRSFDEFKIWLLRKLPNYTYICPECKRGTYEKLGACPHCGYAYQIPHEKLRVPPELYKNTEEGKKELHDYVHKYIFPQLTAIERLYLIQYFTILFSDGFESGDFTAWDSTSSAAGTLAVTQDVPHHGDDVAKFTSDGIGWGGHGRVHKTIAGDEDVIYAKYHVRFDTLITGDDREYIFIDLDSPETIEIARAKLRREAGPVYFWRATCDGIDYDSANFVPTVDTWYCVELAIEVDNVAGWVKLYVDTVLKINQAGIDLSAESRINQVTFGIAKNQAPSVENWVFVKIPHLSLKVWIVSVPKPHAKVSSFPLRLL